MPTVLAKILLFLSSYIPLYIIFTIKLWKNNLAASIILIVFSVFLSAFLWWFLKYWSKNLEPTRDKISQVERKDTEVIVYVFAYIFPFINETIMSNVENMLAYLIFFLLLMLVYVKSNLIHINPILYASGYYIYSVVTDSNKIHTIITTKKRLLIGDTIQVVTVGDDLFVEKING